MFGEDVSDQWKRKKQTPEQKKAARMAKLDPANWKTAKDVYDERAEAAKKRKREEEGATDEQQPESSEVVPASKKQKKDIKTAQPKPTPAGKVADQDAETVRNRNLLKRAKKRAARTEKNRQKRERQEQKQAEEASENQATDENAATIPEAVPKHSPQQSGKNNTNPKRAARIGSGSKLQDSVTPTSSNTEQGGMLVDSEDEVEDGGHEQGMDQSPAVDETMQDGEVSSAGTDEDEDEDEQAAEEDLDDASTAPSSDGVPDVLSPMHDSASSSVSSILPLSNLEPTQVNKHVKNDIVEPPRNTEPSKPIQSDAERDAARQRLQEQIASFRSQRKADDRPVRSRGELLEQRRRKEQERKAAKKEQRRKEKEEEAKRQDEEMTKRFSRGGSGSLLASPRSPMMEEGGGNAFSFGRIAFEDGTQFDPAAGSASAVKKHKGPADPATALKAAQAKEARLSGLDEEKKQNIDEKDMWMNARKRAHGERVKDDTSLLKKALKRQEKQKRRSEKDWDTRVEGVRSAQEAKQKKRTNNLQKRKDEKGTKKAGQKKVKRPGFEGSFRGRTGKSKKN